MKPLLLTGPSGFRIDTTARWVLAYVRGVPVAGVSFREALQDHDGGLRWLFVHVAWWWGEQTAELVRHGGLVTDD